MVASPHFKFVADLAGAFNNGEIALPSFPDIVVRIRKTLEKEDVYIDQVTQVVNTDPVLVSRLLLFANSSAYNPSGNRIETVEAAISRLGFELVKNTAVSLAVRQMFLAEQHKDIAPVLRSIWQNSTQLAAMCAAVVDGRRVFKEETAFLCGLLHFVGKLYIITRARNYPEFKGNPQALQDIMDGWYPKVGSCIVESWDFPEEIAQTLDTEEHQTAYTSKAPTLVDVVVVAKLLLKHVSRASKAGVDPALTECDFVADDEPAMARLGIHENELPQLYLVFQEKLTAVREALTA